MGIIDFDYIISQRYFRSWYCSLLKSTFNKKLYTKKWLKGKPPIAATLFLWIRSSFRLHELLTELPRCEFNNWIPEGEWIVEFLEYFLASVSRRSVEPRNESKSFMRFIRKYDMQEMPPTLDGARRWPCDGMEWKCSGTRNSHLFFMRKHAAYRDDHRQNPVGNASEKNAHKTIPISRSQVLYFFILLLLQADSCCVRVCV